MFYTENSEAIDAKARLKSQFLDVCRRWAEPLHEMSDRTDTHDIGFIIEPALRRDFELTGNQRSLKSILNAAENLAGRYNENTKAIRSWDKFINNAHNYTNKDSHFLVIIDSMCSKLSHDPISLLNIDRLMYRLGSFVLCGSPCVSTAAH